MDLPPRDISLCNGNELSCLHGIGLYMRFKTLKHIVMVLVLDEAVALRIGFKHLLIKNILDGSVQNSFNK